MYTRKRGRKHGRLGGALVVLFAATLAGCAGGGDAGRDTASAGGATGAAAGQPASQATLDADEREVANYRLSMDKVDKYFAAMRNMAIAGKNLPKDTSDAMTDASEYTLDQWVAEIERHPFARRELERAGLKPREVYLIAFSMLGAGVTNAVLKMDPKANVDSMAREFKGSPAVFRANIDFIRRHEAELTAKQKAVEALNP